MPRVAIIGSGLIGRAWAVVSARAGWDAALYDAVEGVDKALARWPTVERAAKHGLVDDPKGSAARVRAAKSVADADGASFAQENVPETVEAARDLRRA
jgi:3-hydroxyacyl-CoA dehydrogenase